MEELIKQGNMDIELIAGLREEQSEVRTATYNMLKEAKSAAENKTESMTLDDVFGED